MIARRALLGALLAASLALPAAAAGKFITVASTTSTENSGLFKALLPAFEQKTEIEVRVVAVGTGQAIKLAQNGDADVLLVHHKPSEEAFVAEGYGVERREVMYNDYVLVGPGDDPAGIAGMTDAAAAMARLAAAGEPFASRGDDSGTHKREQALWKEAGVDLEQAGDWYRETGSGMGATLNTASGMNAYALTDRGTWLSFKNRGELEILVEGDAQLFNQYGVILVSPERFPHVRKDEGQAFIDWLLGEDGQRAIAAYRLEGEQAFFPNAARKPAS
ncbi:substrate-binding domain-containing protein [Marinimicrococcus flavescens]|uniref:Substrate-binding domain-containing protein n=1 Tax=Marinimicrococcus flavescens TaxID=3031815 RepID=A0AAP4D575_9PROT|nr:substrate-binding domain-containing protein [Marinimicrococcus flavescens]